MEATLWSPHGIAVGPSGELVVSGAGSNLLRLIGSDDRISVLAGVPGDPPWESHASHVGRRMLASAAPPAALSPVLEWEHAYFSGSDANAPYDLVADPDGGIVVAGDVGSGADWRLRKLDESGEEVWTFDRSLDFVEIPYALERGEDGELHAAGHTTGDRRDAMVMALSREGEERWRFEPRESGDQVIHDLHAAPDGGLYLVGESNGHWQIWKLSASHQLEWQHRGPRGVAKAIALTADGDLLIAGSSPLLWRVVRFDPERQRSEWDHRVRGEQYRTGSAGAEDIVIDSEGFAFVIGGWTGAARQLRIEKLAPDGSAVWEWIHDTSKNAWGLAIELDPGGGVLAVGEADTDWLVVSVDAAGRGRWEFRHDGGGKEANPDRAHAIRALPNGGIVVSGIQHPRAAEFPSLGLVRWRVAQYQLQ